MGKPSIILTSQFTVAQSFGGFLNYMGREEAKESTDVQAISEETSQDELKRYLHYMDRESALIDQSKMSPADFKELDYLAQHNQRFKTLFEKMKKEPIQKKNFKTGLFDLSTDDLSTSQLKRYEKKFDKAQEKGNVLYQDVVSFDTLELVKAGIYNSYNNHLNREPLIEASRKMIYQLHQEEGLDPSTMSIGAIHYNTQHFHIHLATIEPHHSDRSQIADGQQRGKRKKQTLEKMKSTFANQIFNRSEQLKELSTLRNSLRQEVKIPLQSITYKKQLQRDLKRVMKQLPDERKDWNSKHLSLQAQQSMKILIDHLLKDNPNFKRYKSLAKEEDEFKRHTYGELPKGHRSFYEGRLYGKDGLYYRLSNSILEELKRTPSIKNSTTQYQKMVSQMMKETKYPSTRKESSFNYSQLKFCQRRVEYDLNKMNHHLAKTISSEKEKAKRDYERQERLRHNTSRDLDL